MKTLKLRTFAPLAVLALWGAAGIANAQPQANQDAKPHKGQKAERGDKLKKLAEQLDLTDAQKGLLKPILKDAGESRKALHNDATLTPEQKKEKLKALKADTQTKIEAILTDEQKKKLAALKDKRGEHKGKHDKPATPAANA